MYKLKKFTILVSILLSILVAFSISACGNSVFDSDAEMQVTVRGAYASMDNINKNCGEFLIVEDNTVCEISFFNSLLGQEGDPNYVAMPISYNIKSRDFKNGKIITDTKTYICQDVNKTILSTNLIIEEYNYIRIQKAGNIFLSNAEHFSITSTKVNNSIFNTKTYSGYFTSDISSIAVLLKLDFYDKSFNSVQETKFFYCYQVNKNSTNAFNVEIGNDICEENCTIIAYYI